MNCASPDSIRNEVWDLLRTGEEESVRKAIEITEMLPPPGNTPDDLTAQCLFDTGFGIEYFGDDDAAVGCYRRVLGYPVGDTKYVASAWFRIGVCLNRQGNLGEVAQCYREALRLSESLPHMAALAHFQLAELLESSEEYGEAAEMYRRVLPLLPHPEIVETRVLLGLSRSSWRATRDQAAIAQLRTITREPGDPLSAEAWRLLAEIAEATSDFSEADRAYRQIISSPFSDPSLRGAAAYRLASLRGRL